MTNVQIIHAAIAEITDLANRLNIDPENFTESEAFAMDGICNRLIDRASRIRYRIGQIQDGRK